MILIENTKSHIAGVPALVLKQGMAPLNIILRPGINKISSDIWDKIKTLDVIKNLVENGSLKVALEGDIAEKVSNDESLIALHYTQANKLIKSTFDIALLNKWLESETRAAVVKQINDQIKSLEISPKDDDIDHFI